MSSVTDDHPAPKPQRKPMDRKAVYAVFMKDITAIRRSKAVVLPMLEAAGIDVEATTRMPRVRDQAIELALRSRRLSRLYSIKARIMVSTGLTTQALKIFNRTVNLK